MIVENLDLNAYLPIFIEETRDNIQQISDNLLRLEQDEKDIEAINEIFRAVHTLKGMSATMGYSEISQLAHEAENLLDEVRHNQAHISSAMITGFFHIVDEFEAQLNSLEETGEPHKITEERFQEILDFFSQPQELALAEEESYLLEIFFGKDCLLPQARAMIVCNQLNSVGKLLRTSPAQELLPNLDKLDKLQCWVAGIRPEQVRALLDGGVEIDYYTIEKSGQGHEPEATQETETPEAVEPEGADSSDSRSESHVFRHTIRVDTDKLDQLLNLVSELVINKTSLQQAATTYPLLADGVEHLHRLTSDLQTIVMKMRMIPLETVFNRFPRMVRDTAMSLDKLVNLEIHGAETELDRTIIDDIADPLVHLLRNAIDHGIESVEQRISRGKPRTGTVSLRAYQTGNQVIIEVSDDGRGLDLEHIRAKSRELHLLPGLEPETNELANLIFLPGFSTADNVTDLSGRGVGLDVVKNSIEALGGSIDVYSRPNAGTNFKISLPLTLAIIQGLLVKCGQEIYVIPLSYVEETGIVFPGDIQTVGQQQIIMLRGKVLPIIFLNQLLKTEGYSAPEELSLVVVRYGDRQIGIIVDDLLAQQDIVIKNVNWGEHFFRSFLGCSILGDGSVVMILDINVLLSVVKVREVNHA
jgi:two-component system chemotaxis sensor kinase CheA